MRFWCSNLSNFIREYWFLFLFFLLIYSFVYFKSFGAMSIVFVSIMLLILAVFFSVIGIQIRLIGSIFSKKITRDIIDEIGWDKALEAVILDKPEQVVLPRQRAVSYTHLTLPTILLV